ncbi:hypothetical protein OG921_04905 [Aldersonia sp. NBC_00410]|uniref:hypothetical protein n=1 Tax=Aldersonia sp. NBC_00410 TaxID=2975954 RepID=UPI0022521D87|nr:hypothetical protein [Aldersonia sp. NBC_00410]MCX5042511.1 hypothetical protein [Aldersonia sp. NBC_00410]
MTTNDHGLPSVAERINRLFDAAHVRDAPEQSNEAVAQSISAILGSDLPVDVVTGLRRDDGAESDLRILHAIAKHFDVPARYLTGPDDEVHVLDRELRLLIAARNAGVRKIAMRGGGGGLADDIARVLEELPAQYDDH